MSELDIQDADGDTVIKVTSDGATHIGENSLVTIESGGRQQLYATDATGNRIDINIPSGSNLLIDGEDVIDGPNGRWPEGHKNHPWEAEAIQAEKE